MKVEKSRFLILHPDTNPGKIKTLDALQAEYTAYVLICVLLMIEKHRFKMDRTEKQAFFPGAEFLTSQIEKNARDHAIGIVKGWAASAYTNRVKKEITKLKKNKEITGEVAKSLYTIGKYSRQIPSGSITQEHLDAYWELLLKTVKTPDITDKIGIRMSENTCRLESSDEATHADFWIQISTLQSRNRIWLPLVGSPYVKTPDQVGKGFLARKTKRGLWRFEALGVKDWEVPDIEDDSIKEWPHIGVDVGLNVVAATSDGRLYGTDLKPKFNRLYETVREVRANRQRQGLKENSPRLDRLESRLSGLTKTAVGTVSNQMKRDYPDHIFEFEDLDLQGCRGSKRFCYRALYHNHSQKVPVGKNNPAYTSQECPWCHYVSRRNRDGVKFHCKGCGRKAHADTVGAMNILGRSRDESIHCDDNVSRVGKVLRDRYRALRRDRSLESSGIVESVPSDPRLTVMGGSFRGKTRTASNSMPKIT